MDEDIELAHSPTRNDQSWGFELQSLTPGAHRDGVGKNQICASTNSQQCPWSLPYLQAKLSNRLLWEGTDP